MKQKSTGKDKFSASYNAAISEIIERKKERGYVARLTRELSRITGQTFQRQQVEMWIRNDPAERTQPLFGAGLLLLQAANNLKNTPAKR